MVAITNIVVGSFAASAAFGSPLSSSCKSYSAQLTNLVQEVPDAQHFCSSWLSTKQSVSLIKGVSGAVLTNACQCATQDTASARVLASTPQGNAGALAGAAAASICKNVQLAKILSGIKNVQYFCSTFNPSQWGSRSPIFGASSQAIQQACQCVLNAATATPTPVTSTTTSISQPPATSSPAPAPGPSGPMQPFKFCPSSTSQIGPFKLFCKTPLWKAWACSCSSVAQVCFPNQQLTWCPRPSTSASPSPSASAPASSSISTIPVSSSSTPSPIASSSSSVTTIPTPTTTPAPVSSSTEPSITDAPIVSSSTADAPVSQAPSSTDDGSLSSTTSADDSAPTS